MSAKTQLEVGQSVVKVLDKHDAVGVEGSGAGHCVQHAILALPVFNLVLVWLHYSSVKMIQAYDPVGITSGVITGSKASPIGGHDVFDSKDLMSGVDVNSEVLLVWEEVVAKCALHPHGRTMVVLNVALGAVKRLECLVAEGTAAAAVRLQDGVGRPVICKGEQRLSASMIGC